MQLLEFEVYTFRDSIESDPQSKQALYLWPTFSKIVPKLSQLVFVIELRVSILAIQRQILERICLCIP